MKRFWAKILRSSFCGAAPFLGSPGARRSNLPPWRMLLCLTATCALAQPTYPDLLAQFPYRNLGPFRAGAWVDSIAVA